MLTQGLLCRSSLGLLLLLVRGYNILPKKKLRRRVWVVRGTLGFRVQGPGFLGLGSRVSGYGV